MTFKESKTIPVGEEEAIPSAIVTLWKALPNGDAEQYAVEVSGPLKDGESPGSIVALTALFHGGKGPVRDVEYLKLRKTADNVGRKD